MLNVKQDHFLSLIVPAYKQEKIIVKNLRRLIKELDLIRYDYEIIVVIDGETDNSLEKLKESTLKKVKIVSYKNNRGKSYAVRLGMSKAQGDYIMFVDAGMEIDPNGISMLLEHMEWYEADIIVGSKRHPASKVNYNWQRKMLSFGYYYVVRFLFGVKVKDTQAGIKIFKKEVLEKVLPRLIEKRFAGDLEILVVAKLMGFKRVFEAPIKLNYDFTDLSSAATLGSIYGIFIDTLAIFYRSKILGYYKKSHLRMVEPDDLKIINLK
jgi:glycosyltransferase involved in cell wall biosynthesis